MNESVIYALKSEDRVLCEWRDLNGTKQNCILGGNVEICDRMQDDYVIAAARREAKEELGISTEQCLKLGEFVSDDVKYHIVCIDRWLGTVPQINHDNHNELHWVPLKILIDSIALNPLKEIINKLKTT